MRIDIRLDLPRIRGTKIFSKGKEMYRVIDGCIVRIANSFISFSSNVMAFPFTLGSGNFKNLLHFTLSSLARKVIHCNVLFITFYEYDC